MEFLEEHPDVQSKAEHFLTKFEKQIEKLRKSDIVSYLRKIEKETDLEAKSKHLRSLLETNVPACVDLLDRLLAKSKNVDKLQYLEWMSHRQHVAMSLESFNRARSFAEEAYFIAKECYRSFENDSTNTTLHRKPSYKAFIKACVNLLLVCRYQGKLTDAQKYLEEAKSVALAEKDKDNEHLLLILHGDLLLARGQLNNAIENVFSPLLNDDDISLQNKGLLLQKLGNACRSAARWGAAKDYLRESIEIACDLDDLISKYDRATDLGNVYRSEGRIADALHNQMTHMTFSHNRGDLWGLTVACFNMGFAYYSITPKPDLCRALILLSLKYDLANRTDNEPLRGMALNNLGKVFCAISNYNMALKVMTQSVLVAKKTFNVAGEGMAYGNIGTAYRAIGKYDDAIENHNKYLQNASGRGDDGGCAIMQRELAIDYLCKGDMDNAEKQVRDAISTLEIIRNKLGGDDTSKIANFDKNQAETYSLLQVILARQGKHAEALALSELARSRALTDIIRDKLIKSSGIQTSSWIYSSDFVSRWQNLVPDILSDFTKSADELKTNFLVYSILKDYDSNGATQQCLYIWIVLNEKASEDQQRIQFRKVTLNEKIDSDLLADNQFFASLTRSFRILSSDGESLQNKMKMNKVKGTEINPPEKKIHVRMPEGPDVEEFLLLLQSLSLAETSLNIPNRNEKSEAPTSDTDRETGEMEKEHQIDRTDRILERRMERGAWKEEGSKQLQELYKVCIAPVEDYLPVSNEDEVLNVTIIPHEFLFSVPFCCLLDANGKYLVERCILTYAPSLRALLLLNQRLRNLKEKQGDREIKVLAMGNPAIAVPGLHDLPNAGEEAKNVRAVFGSEVCQLALRYDATKKLLLQQLTDIDIVHVATHASPENAEVRSQHFPREMHGMYKLLVGKDQSQGDYVMRGCVFLASSHEECEGILEADEIASVDCTCQLVMLSCCETGLGKVTGDGVVGLYRAFFAAGAASVVVTLWKIPDEITPIFMQQFYENFKETGNAAASLRYAMMDSIHNKQLPPQHWASFSFIGSLS